MFAGFIIIDFIKESMENSQQHQFLWQFANASCWMVFILKKKSIIIIPSLALIFPSNHLNNIVHFYIPNVSFICRWVADFMKTVDSNTMTRWWQHVFMTDAIKKCYSCLSYEMKLLTLSLLKRFRKFKFLLPRNFHLA